MSGHAWVEYRPKPPADPDPRPVAWSVETWPIDPSTFTPAQKRRAELETFYLTHPDRGPNQKTETEAAFCFHPSLVKIIALGLDRGRGPYAFDHRDHDGEEGVLRAFWEAIGKIDHPVRWVTFNGKSFDVPMLVARSLVYGIVPTRRDILDVYPFNNYPHCDLSRVVKHPLTLVDLCELCHVETRKDQETPYHTLTMDQIVDRVMGDVVDTLACFDACSPFLKL